MKNFKKRLPQATTYLLAIMIFPFFGFGENNPTPQVKKSGNITYIDIGIHQPNVEDCYSTNILLPDISRDAGTVKIFPNPGNGIFTLELRLPMIVNQVDIVIYDIAGKQVYNYTENMDADAMIKTMDLAFLEKGIYFVRAITRPGYPIRTHRLIIF